MADSRLVPAVSFNSSVSELPDVAVRGFLIGTHTKSAQYIEQGYNPTENGSCGESPSHMEWIM